MKEKIIKKESTSYVLKDAEGNVIKEEDIHGEGRSIRKDNK